VTFADLQDPGFLWFAPEGATFFEIVISPTLNPSQQFRFERDIRRLELDDSDRNFFNPGPYIWTVTILEGQGAGSSATGRFQIGTTGSLVPTPTPNITPTPVPPGENTPIPTPTPPVGLPHNFQFDPGQEVTFSEVRNLTISWDPPAFPEGATFTYDVLIIFPGDFTRIEKNALTQPQVVPLQEGTTFANEYTVHVRAKNSRTGEVSDIATTTFTVRPNIPQTPSPTPELIDPDLSRDGETNVLDLGLFLKAFQAQSGQATFQNKADYTRDGIIDQEDLLVFVSLFSQKGQQSAKPQWLFADVPLMDDSGPFCEVIGRRDPIQFPPNEITFGINGEKCILAEITGTNENFDNGTRFHFSAVPNAVDYRVSITTQKPGILPANEFDTGGNTSFGLVVTTPDNGATIVVRALGPNGELGPPSDPLQITVPAIEQP